MEPVRQIPRRITRRLALAAAAALFAVSPLAQAQSFPSKPLKIVNPYAPGGPGDALCRTVAALLSTQLGQPVIVESKTGGSGSIGTLAVRNAPGDGYTMLLTTITTVVQVPLVTKDPGFDPAKAMIPIGNVGLNPLALLAHPSVPAHDFPSFVEWARKQPAGVDVAVAGPTLEVASALLAQQAKVKLVNIPFRGQAPALQSVLAGDVKIFYNTPSGPLAEFIKQGKLKVLGVSSAEPSPLIVGGVPISKYVPGYVQDINYALWVSPGTPPEIVARLVDALKKGLAEPGLADKLHAGGMTLAAAGPEEVTRITVREATNIRKIMETTPVKFGE